MFCVNGFPDNWSVKAIRRKTTGTGRMRYLRNVPRRFKTNFREGTPFMRGSSSVSAFYRFNLRFHLELSVCFVSWKLFYNIYEIIFPVIVPVIGYFVFLRMFSSIKWGKIIKPSLSKSCFTLQMYIMLKYFRYCFQPNQLSLRFEYFVWP